jgi:hypothetical protein
MQLDPETIAALHQLALAFMHHPKDVKTLEDYGQISTHLSNVYRDLILKEPPADS